MRSGVGQEEPGAVSAGWLVTQLAGHGKGSGPHPGNNGKSLKSFRQRSTMNRLVFHSNPSGF